MRKDSDTERDRAGGASGTGPPAPVRNIGDRRGARLPSLTGIRGAAAILVFLFHISTSGLYEDDGVNEGLHSTVDWAGYMALSMFFVLSGFVMAWTAPPGDTRRRFWRRRAAKVFPNHVVAWVLAMLLMICTGITVMPFADLPSLSSADGILPFLSSLFLVQAWVPRLEFYVSANPVSWSLACEVFFYLIFPWLALGIRRIRPERLWHWAIGTVAAMAAVPLAVRLLVTGGPALAWNPGLPEWQNYAVHFFPPSRALEFVLGIIVARLVLAGRWPRIGVPKALALLAVAYAVALNVPYLFRLSVTALPVAVLLAALAVSDLRESNGPLSRRPMVWLGETSFAFYLLHMFVITYGHEAIGVERTWSVPAGTAIIAGFYAVALLLAWLLNVVVENPTTRRFSRSRRSRPPRLAVPPGPRVLDDAR